jgi:hypothetical protein
MLEAQAERASAAAAARVDLNSMGKLLEGGLWTAAQNGATASTTRQPGVWMQSDAKNWNALTIPP